LLVRCVCEPCHKDRHRRLRQGAAS
jgi:hypothetical protein